MRLSRRFGMLAVAAILIAGAANAQTTALRGARLIDGSGNAPIDNGTVIIANGQIVAIGSSDTIAIPSGAEIVDYSGKTIIPGLISVHSHIGIQEALRTSPDNYNRAFILKQLKQYEAYGVTTVTSLGLNGPLFYELRSEMRAGAVPGADILGADRGIGVVNGAPPATIVNIGANQLYRPTTPEAAREAVREMVSRKTDLIKVWLDTFGGMLPVKVAPEVFQAVIDEAHKANIRVAAHIYELEDAKAVLRAGVDIIAHGVRDKPVDAEFIELMKARSAWYVATAVLDDTNFVFAENPAWMQEPFFQRAAHPGILAVFNDPAWREKVLASPAAAKAKASLAMNKQNLKALADAGVNIAFGSDSGVGLRIPGAAEHRELVLLVEAGLTPLQAITIATSKSAEALNLKDRGTLAVGKLADLVVLEADPTAQIDNSRKIHAVWHRGKNIAGSVETFRQ